MKKKPAQPEATPADPAGFERFQTELARLVAKFERGFKQVQGADYNEAKLRMDFLDPLFLALGWDITNDAELIPQHREVEIESRTEIAGRQKRADYLFRTDRQDRFVCEAKKPAETLHKGYAFQAKRYAWNKGLVLAVLSDFEEMKIYLVGSKPHPDEVEAGEWKTWHFLEYAKYAQDIWNLLSRDAVAGGSIEKLVASLPRKPAGKTKAKQQWLFKPDRARAIDADFLDFLDEARRGLASDLIRHNDRADLLEGTRLDEAVQRILDRLLFLRICEDRDIDTGRPLAAILKTWRDRKDTPLWREIVAHFRALDRRPASHIPYFNGNLFKEHFSEDLEVGDEWMSGFLEETGDEESAYLFNVIPVEILGTIYERFLGKTVRPHGRGVVIEEKPEVRKAGGVYYTPRYIVDYIVEQTLGKLLEGKSPQDSLKLRVLDPACGSGSFLIRAYERLCEHWQIALTKDEKLRRKADCWTDSDTGDVHLTSDLKRRILTATIYGVDLDPGAVEVTQLSLYLKMLEGESRTTLAKNRELFGPDAPLLPPLQDNVKCGNSLIASDFSLNPDDLTRVRAFDWPEGFRDIMQNGGFDVVIGNPPYVRMEEFKPLKTYLSAHYESHDERTDLYVYFIEKSICLLNIKGLYGVIVSNKWLKSKYGRNLRGFVAANATISHMIDFGELPVFQDAATFPVVIVTRNGPSGGTGSFFFADSIDKATFRRLEYGEINLAHIEATKAVPMPHANFSTGDWHFGTPEHEALLSKMKVAGKTLSEYSGNKIRYGIKTGLVSAFIINEDTKNRLVDISPAAATIIKPYVVGDDVRKYHIRPEMRFLIYTYRGVDLTGCESVLQYLAPFKSQLAKRATQQEWYELQQAQYAYAQDYEAVKILYPDIAKDSRFALDTTGLYPADTTFCIPLNDKYLLGILNSRAVFFFLKSVCPVLGDARIGGRLRLKLNYIKELPIPIANALRHDKLVALVDKMLLLVPKLRAAKSEGDRATLANAVAATDRAIDALVYELYGLTAEEIALVEAST